MMRMSNREQWLLWFLSGIFFLAVVFYNGFPVLNYDSGAYLYNAYTGELPFDRPITYSWFIRIVSLQKFLFPVVIIQSFLVSFFLVRILGFFVVKFLHGLWLMSAMILTQLPFYIAYLTPDIFTPLVFLASLLYFLSENKVDRICSIAVVFLGVMMHNSNLLTGVLTISVLAFLNVFIRTLAWRRIFILVKTIAVSILLMSLIHFMYEGKFRPSNGGSVFLMAKLAEKDVLKTYLEDHCGEAANPLCQHINELPQPVVDFIFSPNGMVHKVGGPGVAEPIFNRMTRQMLGTAKYRNMYVKNCLNDFKQQIVMTNIYEDVASYLDGTNPYWKVSQLYTSQLPVYSRSKQSRGQLSFTTLGVINQYFQFMLLFSFVLLTVMSIIGKNNTLKMMAMATVVFILSNALICSSLNVVFSRLNSRVIWLICFISFLMFIDWLNNYVAQRAKKEKGNPETAF